MDKQTILKIVNDYPDSDIAIAFKLGQDSIERVPAPVIISGIPHCHRGHTHHTYVPWMYNTEYDQVCNICGHEAPGKYTYGKFYLCDCCAEDWSAFCDKQREKGVPLTKGNWQTLFVQFRDELKASLSV